MDELLVEYNFSVMKIGFQQILNKKLILTFDELYNHACTIVRHNCGERLYKELKEVITHHLQTEVCPVVLGSLPNNFLATLNQAWNDHQTSMGMIRGILLYMHNRYIQWNNLDDVMKLGLIMFYDQVVGHKLIYDHMRHTLLYIVVQERSGEITQRESFKAACNMLIALGIGSRSVYEQIFETTFLAQSAEYYKAESNRFLLENSVSVSIQRIKTFIAEESERAKNLLDKSTEERIVAVIDEEFIQKHVKTIVEMEHSGVSYMLESRNLEDLRCMYELLGRVTDGHETLVTCVSAHLRAEGRTIVAGANAVIVIQSLLDLKKFLALTFEHDHNFKKVISLDLEYLVNLNPKFPEYLSLFIDDKLRTKARGMTEQDIEILLDQTLLLFCFLQETDIFEYYYKKHLAKRLLLNKSVSDDSEKSMVSKLKTECGCQFTFKLEGMFNDMSVTNTINGEFRKHIQTTGSHASLGEVELYVSVLTTGFWPTLSSASCNLPLAASHAFNKFRTFYSSKHSGRLLTLHPNLGTADLSAVFYGPRRDELEGKEKLEQVSSSSLSAAPSSAPRKHLIQVSTCQMCILMLFNSRDRLTYEEIANETNLEKQELDRALQSLALGKTTQRILLKTPKGKDILPSSIFRVNDSFTSKLYRVKIQTVKANEESEPELMETMAKVDEGRKREIEAAIVRILKNKKSIQHNLLIAEVTNELKSRFLPSPVDIKKRIEALIERGYLARTPENRAIYRYVA